MAKTTYREYLVWHAWLESEWERPSLTDHYLMQIAAMIYGAFGKGKTKSLDQFKLKPERRKDKRKSSPEEIKRFFLRMVGMGDKHGRRNRD